jgi:hypothetical protein
MAARLSLLLYPLSTEKVSVYVEQNSLSYSNHNSNGA